MTADRVGGADRRAPAIGSGSTILLLAVTHFAAHADRVLPTVVAPILQVRFALTDGAMGLLLGPAFAIAYIVGTLIAGAVVDRVRRYRVIAWSLIVWSLASLATGLAQRWEDVMVARIVMGLGQAALAPAALSILLQQSSPGGGRRVATFTSGATLGRSAALLVSGALLTGLAALPAGWSAITNAASWRLLFVLTAAPNLILAVALFRQAEPPAQAVAPTMRGDAWRWSRGHRSALAVHLMVSSAAIVLTQALGAWAPSLLVRAAGTTLPQAAMLTGVVVLVAGPAGHHVGGILIDRARRDGGSPAAVLAVLFLLAIPCAALLGSASGTAAIVTAFFALSFVLGACAVAALAAFQPLVPARWRGGGNAVYFATVSLVGLGLGPPIVGFVSDVLGAGSTGALGTALTVVTVVVALPAAITSFANRTRWSVAAAAAAER